MVQWAQRNFKRESSNLIQLISTRDTGSTALQLEAILKDAPENDGYIHQLPSQKYLDWEVLKTKLHQKLRRIAF